MRRGVARVQDGRVVLAFFANFNDIVGLYDERWNIDALAIDVQMAVAHQLASLGARSGKAHPVKRVVETAFQQVQHILAGDALSRAGFFEQIAELAFEKLIITAGFLLFAKLETVADDLRLTIL